MKKRGWIIEEQDAILNRILPDDDVVVRQLRTTKGQAFWQEIRRLPGGIDRLDRLARMPQGKANVPRPDPENPQRIDVDRGPVDHAPR